MRGNSASPADIVSVGAEYAELPAITLGGITLRSSAFAADVRVFPFQSPFFIGAKLGHQHVEASTSFTFDRIGTFTGSLDLADYRDDYQEGLREIIDAKIAGREIVAPDVQEPPKVVNLMEALRRSLDAIGVPTRTPAKSALEPEAPARKAAKSAPAVATGRKRKTA